MKLIPLLILLTIATLGFSQEQTLEERLIKASTIKDFGIKEYIRKILNN